MKNLLLIFLLSSCAVYAQEDFSSPKKDSTSYNTFKEHVPFWRMEKNWKFTPFDVFSVVPTLGVDLETRMSPGVSFQYGLAGIPTFMQFTTINQGNRFNWMNGYRLRFESRFWGFKNPNLYVSTELSVRHLIISDETAFGMEGDGFGGFAFHVIQDMIYHRFSTHLNFKVGWQKIFNERMVLDMYIGLSFRRNNVISNTPTPAGGEIDDWFNPLEWTLEDGHKFGYALPIVGFRLGLHRPAKSNI